MPSTQLVSVMSVIWQHVSTSEGHLQASSINNIKGIVYNCQSNIYFIKLLNCDLISKLNTIVHNLFCVFCSPGLKMTL